MVGNNQQQQQQLLGQFSARAGSADTGINTQQVLAMNDAVRFDAAGESQDMGDPGQFEQESEMMSHQEDRLLLVENDTMHDTMIRDLLNSKPTVKG